VREELFIFGVVVGEGAAADAATENKPLSQR
jgi:hypothetical protein